MYMIKMQAACLGVTLLLAFYCRRSRHLNTRTSRIFRINLKVVIVNLIFDMITVYTVNHLDTVSPVWNRLAHIIFVGTMEIAIWLLLHYIILLIENDKVNPKIFRIFTDIPLIAALLVTVGIPFSYMETPAGNYSYGLPVFMCFGLMLYDLLISWGLTIKFQRSISREKEKVIIPALMILTVIFLIQFLAPTLLVSSFGLTITVLCIFLARENPEDFFNKETGMFNETAFLKMLHENVRTREEFHVVLFTVSNMDMILEQWGGRVVNECLYAISNKIYQVFRHNTYALDNNELVFFAGSRQAAESNAAFLNRWLLKPLKINGEEILIETQMKAWTFVREENQQEESILYEIEAYFTKELAKTIYMDHFAGVMNRNAYERDLAHMARSLNNCGDLWCSIVDINNLKKMNDSCGHQAGDALIQGCAKILMENMPEDARIYRIGGDEFAILCISKTKEQMEQIFRRIDKACEEMNEGISYPIDFAAGTVEYDPSIDSSLFDAFARADKKMYQRKEQMHLEQMAQRSEDDWNWIREMDTLSYENLLFEAASEMTENYLFIENKITNMTRWSSNAVDDFELAGKYVYQGLKHWGKLIHPEDREKYERSLNEIYGGIQKNYRCVYRIKNRWGEYVTLAARGYLSCDENGKARIFAGSLKPVKQNAGIYPGTLQDKYEFTNRIRQLCESGNTSNGILLIGLNHFRKINTMYSYAVGDEVLRTVANIIEGVSPAKSSLYRYDGDMFAVIYSHTNRGELHRLFEKLEKSLESFELESGEVIYLTISGGAVMLEEGMTCDGVKSALENAVRVAKQTGRGVLEYASGSQMQATASRFRMRDEIRKCVREHMYGFYLNFQPILRGEDKELFGCEALLRWSHPNFKNGGPEQFIPILEETGQINEAGRWVISTALKQVKEWRKYKPDMSVNVNVSYAQLHQPDLAVFIVNELKRMELPPDSIVVEMTESCKINNYDGVIAFVNYLRANHIAFALDDFGTGYSSFEVLKNVPVDWIKLEHHYVSSIKNSITDRNIIIHIIELCHSLGIKVCAEGIEDEECCEAMRERNVEFLQGYYISRPLSAGRLEEEFLYDKVR